MTHLITAGLLASGVLIGLGLGGWVGFWLGYRRGQYDEGMEPPQRGGEMHFAEGRIREIRAGCAGDAIDRLIQTTRYS